MPVLCDYAWAGHSRQGYAPDRVSIRMASSRMGCPGATSIAASDFPGSHKGTRHFPGDTKRMPPKGRERVEKFEMKPMRDYYQEFPGLVRSSFPLYVRKAGKQEPLGQLEQREKDAGPQTGMRRMPEAVDLEGRLRPRMAWLPDDKQDLMQEKKVRHAIDG